MTTYTYIGDDWSYWGTDSTSGTTEYKIKKPILMEDWWKNWEPNPQPEDPRDIFDKNTTITTKEGELIILTYGTIYEIEKLTGKKIEELTKKQINDYIMVLKL